MKADRPSTSITMRLPVDVLEDLRRVAPLRGVSGYQGLIKLYIGQALRKDLAALREAEAAEVARGVLERHAVAPAVVEEVVNALRPVALPHQDKRTAAPARS